MAILGQLEHGEEDEGDRGHRLIRWFGAVWVIQGPDGAVA